VRIFILTKSFIYFGIIMIISK